MEFKDTAEQRLKSLKEEVETKQAEIKGLESYLKAIGEIKRKPREKKILENKKEV